MALRRLIRPAIKGAGMALGAATAGAAYGYYTDEGFKRMLEFNAMCLPIFFRYKYVQITTKGQPPEEVSKAYAPLHEIYAPRALEIALKQQGFYIKLAQVISALGPEVVPQIYYQTLKVLQDDVPAKPFYVVRRIIQDDLGCPLEQLFATFAEKPIGAASIGQVHEATLHNGLKVVVKVQYPEAEKNFHIDMDLFMRACRSLVPEQLGVLQGIQRNFINEFDYAREAKLQRAAADRAKYLNEVVVPLPLDGEHPACPPDRKSSGGLCTKRILVQEKLEGLSLQKWSTDNLKAMAAKERKTVDELLDGLRSMPASELKRRLPGPATLRAYAAVVELRDFIRNSFAFGYNWTFGWIGAPINYASTPRPLNIFQVVNILLHAQGHLIFDQGFVNGDPHPGNIMLLPTGKVGLIDWGQVVQLTKEQRCTFAKLIIALADRDEKLTAMYSRECGAKYEGDNDWVHYKAAAFYLGSFQEAKELGGIALVDQNLNKLGKCHSNLRQGDYLMPTRNIILTRQGLTLLGQRDLNTADQLRGVAEACLEREGEAMPKTVRGRQARLPSDFEHLTGLRPPKRAKT